MKRYLQKIVLGGCIILTMPLSVLFRISKSKKLFAGQAQLMALVPGTIGSYLRVAYYCMTLEACSSKGYIGFGTFIAHPETELGRGYYIGAFTIIGTAKIGDHATIASHVSILSGNSQHGFKQIGKPIQEQTGVYRKITIGANCWIGNGAIIMDDLGIQNVIAAGSVVTKKTEDYVVVAGNPAKEIKKIYAK
ncbi:acyltransferase [Desulfatitalea alkaliphila]|uniref:Acyltransferase n=1 Tax=Desulfatitalea alkaliphila TaxID=2929485 RepID=A0AA41UL82_9BACT|nr:acyltransferase [Desulfatitalea alkaliphila]MCJ8503129.1 acyltransferase [Desulfatitalea alkaliphila]